MAASVKCQECGATAVEPCMKENVELEQDCVRSTPEKCPECGASTVESCRKDTLELEQDCARSGNGI